MNDSNLKGFRIVAHTHHLSREGGGRAGYHCPSCGCFYAEGNFTIENTTHVLGNPDSKTCCRKMRPTPQLFETVDEARDFLKELEKSGMPQKATLIKKFALVVAHFNQKMVTEQKRKVLH